MTGGWASTTFQNHFFGDSMLIGVQRCVYCFWNVFVQDLLEAVHPNASEVAWFEQEVTAQSKHVQHDSMIAIQLMVCFSCFYCCFLHVCDLFVMRTVGLTWHGAQEENTYPKTWSNPSGAVLLQLQPDLWVAERPFVWNSIDVSWLPSGSIKIEEKRKWSSTCAQKNKLDKKKKYVCA